jgi:hypothetical protein
MECKNILESGELDLNTGCPVCGGKKFQYIRARKELRETREKELRKPKTAEPEPVVKAKPEAKDKKPAHERIESVRILEKGSYDINLPILLNRKELVMSKEEGVYVVDLPSALKTPKKKKRWQHKE